ncbi:YigZ family protein [Lachnospiraceae bacterium C1.1]|nr:YigZ family protein [Lachnospiraceae bacterium C1.1]
MNSYRTVQTGKIFSGEITEKKSRFIAALKKAESVEEASAFLLSEKKKYYDAKHHCSAYIIAGEDGAQDIMHSSDDGEPSGTAGKPMLDILKGEGLKNVILVVTRYFGGTLLGTGGLVRAYSAASKDAISNTEFFIVKELVHCSLEFDYASEPKIRRFLRERECVLGEPEYSEKVRFNIYIEPDEENNYRENITDMLNGNVEFKVLEKASHEVPENS